MLNRAASMLPLALLRLAACTLPATAAPAPKLILAFGDSLTAGYGLPAREGFTAQLERALAATGYPATVHNAGVSGDTSQGGRARLAWVLAGLHAKPDLVILELGANDMLRGVDPAATRANLDAMLATLTQKHIPVLFAGMLATPNLGQGYVRQFDQIYPDLARKYPVTFYPFFLKGAALHPELIQVDRLHPNAAGVAAEVRNIAPIVVRALAPAR